MRNTILIVEDEKEVLELLGLYLQEEGYKVLLANGGAEGIKIAKDENPDLILLDIQMPEMNGY